MTDDQILKAIQNRGPEAEKAMKYLIQNTALENAVYGTLHKMNAQQHDIQDIHFESLMILYRNIIRGKFKESSSIATYLIGICKNQWLNQQKKLKGIEYGFKDEIYINQKDTNTPEILLFEKEESEINEKIRDLLRQQLQKLSKKCQQILSMWSEGKSMKVIQRVLNYDLASSVATKKGRCRNRLRQLILDDPDLANFLKSGIQ